MTTQGWVGQKEFQQMAQTLYVSFQNAEQAEKAAGALLDYGAKKEDISLVVNDQDVQSRYTNVDANTYDQSVRGRTAEAGDRTVAATSATLGARPATGEYATAADVRAVGAGFDAGTTYSELDRDDLDEMDDADASVYKDSGDLDRAAKQGISTTTPGDAGSGAAKGAGIGLGVGVLAGLASLFIPGVGMVIGGGALATAIGGAVGTTAAGAVAGGVTGYFKEQGVPDDAVQQYSNTLSGQGAVLAIGIPSGKVDEGIARQVVSKYGGGDVNLY
jgi:uncharacterized membrane protein